MLLPAFFTAVFASIVLAPSSVFGTGRNVLPPHRDRPLSDFWPYSVDQDASVPAEALRSQEWPVDPATRDEPPRMIGEIVRSHVLQDHPTERFGMPVMTCHTVDSDGGRSRQARREGNPAGVAVPSGAARTRRALR
ncbi:hypothetical protein [Jannaschia rubra]|uniref:hypothetical protein n=1 Tax=Jannaschia rubra TaxID=282197 RepID=UPI002490B2A8|nr:hypothetical protein [Jannaschia rubra]